MLLEAELAILNAGYDSANYYLIGEGPTRLLVDVGWPGTLPKLLGVLKRKGASLQEVKFLLATHYHPDHAGLAQELKNQGVELVVLESQLAWVSKMGTWMKPEQHYQEIQLNDVMNLEFKNSHSFLRSLKINGEIISTPGHSADSVTLILDEGCAFTGDLPDLMMATETAVGEVEKSWEKILTYPISTIYPGHGPPRPVYGPVVGK
jgi:glyoxylase-like metal-dependent hydrolase (beta-lactamase superfamily II)